MIIFLRGQNWNQFSVFSFVAATDDADGLPAAQLFGREWGPGDRSHEPRIPVGGQLPPPAPAPPAGSPATAPALVLSTAAPGWVIAIN